MTKKLSIGLLFAASFCGACILIGQAFAQSPDQNRLYWTTTRDARLTGPMQQDAELNAKIHEGLQQYLAAKDDAGHETAKKQVQEALAKLFDIRQKEREDEIKQIETRVAHLRETLKKRDAMREQLIEHHLTTLIQDAEGLGWGVEGNGGQGGVNYAPVPIMQPYAAPPGGALFAPPHASAAAK